MCVSSRLPDAPDEGEPEDRPLLAHENDRWAAAYIKCPLYSARHNAVAMQGKLVPGWVMHHGRLLHNNLCCVPTDLLEETCREAHLCGHFGARKQELRFRRNFEYHNPTIRHVLPRDVIHRIRRECGTCQATDHRHSLRPGGAVETPIPRDLFQGISVDFLSLPTVDWGGELLDRVMVVVDQLSGYVIAEPMSKSIDAPGVGQVMYDRVFSKHGNPAWISSDQDVLFTSQWWRVAMKLSGTRLAMSTAYRPQGNGRAEAAVKAVVNRLRSCILDPTSPMENWRSALFLAVAAINDTPGIGKVSPDEIVFGRGCLRLGETAPIPMSRRCEDAETWIAQRTAALAKFHEECMRERARQVQNFNRGRPEPPTFAIGDLVWWDRSDTAKKLEPPWSGPHPVVSRVSSANKYWIRLADGTTKVTNVDRLRSADLIRMGEGATPMYFARPQYSRRELDEVPVMPISEILGYRMTSDGHQEWQIRREGSRELQWVRVNAFVPTPLPHWQSFNRSRRIAVDYTALPRK